MSINKNIKFLIIDVDGTMTDSGIYVTEDGSQFKKFNAKDGLGIKMCVQAGIEVGIISHSATSGMILQRAKHLGIKHCYVGQEKKTDVLNRWIQELNIPKENMAFIGDDLNDLDMIQAVGYTACPSDAVAKIQQEVDTVLSKKGGEGCVREFIDRYLLD